MEELFPQSVFRLVPENELMRLLHEQCLRDLERSGFQLESGVNELPSVLIEKLAVFFRRLSSQEIVRISYVTDIPDSILRAAEHSAIPIEVFAEAFVRRAALKVVTRLNYSRK